ncbi:Pullulanase 1, chloroplastic [Trifolium repens]|nr:Pullulanase 1, chloroplastic [Trifolium repens]
MVQALNHTGLRIVLDTVYNHLQGSGPSDEHSFLDKIVPDYYLRRNTNGFIEHSTCMNNTVSEHFMVEHLILCGNLLPSISNFAYYQTISVFLL